MEKDYRDAWEKHGIQWAGQNFKTGTFFLTPTYHSASLYHETPVSPEQESIMNTRVPNLLKTTSSIPAGIYKNIGNDHMINPHAGSVINAFQIMQDSSQSLFNVASLDIETLGTSLAQNRDSKMFAITEIGISNWTMNKNFYSKEVQGQSLSLVGHIDAGTQAELSRLIQGLKTGAINPYSLTADERRSLRDLLKYEDSSKFGKFGNLNTFSAGKNVKLPELSFNPANMTQRLETALNNLKANSNAVSSLADTLTNHLAQTDAIIGHNIATFDLPVLANYFSSNGGGKFANALKGFVKNEHKKFIVDTQAMIEFAFPNLISDISKMIKDDKRRAAYVYASGGHLTEAALANAFGLNTQTHTALEDTRLVPRIINKMSKQLAPVMQGAVIPGFPNFIDSRTRFIAKSGLSPFEAGAYDSVYSLKNNEYQPAYNQYGPKVSRGGLYKSAVYEVQGIDYFAGGANNPFGHQYGSYMLRLHNIDDDLMHTFIREDNAAGTGFSSIENIFYKHMSVWDGKTRAGLEGVMEDRAMRTFRGLFEVKGSYEKTRDWYRAAAVGGDVTGIIKTNAQLRDFSYLKGRMQEEYKFMGEIFDELDTRIARGMINEQAAKASLVSLRNILEGNEPIPGLDMPSTYAEIKGTQFRDMSGGLLRLGNRAEILSSLKALIANGDKFDAVPQLVQELGRKGYLSKEEVSRFEAQAEYHTKPTFILKEVANLIKTRTELSGGMAASYDPESLKQAMTDKTFHMTSASKSWAATYYNTDANGRLLDGNPERQNIIKEHIFRAADIHMQQGIVDHSTYKVQIPSSARELLGMVTEHDKNVNNLLFYARNAKDNVIKPGNIKQRLEELGNAYVGQHTSVKYIKGINDNLIDMVVFRNTQAKALENLSSKQLLEHPDVVIMHIPLSGKTGLLEVGRQSKVDRSFLVPFGGETIKIKTGTDLIIDEHIARAGNVKWALGLEGTKEEMRDHITRARNNVNMGFEDVFARLSGIGMEETEEAYLRKVDFSSMASKKWRNTILDYKGIWTLLFDKPYEQMKDNEAKLSKFKVSSKLKEKYGIDANLASTKESWANHMYLSTRDIRTLYPFSEFSPIVSQILVQNLNMAQVDLANVEEGRQYALKPLVMTDAAKDYFNINGGGVPGGINIKVGYIAPGDMPKLGIDDLSNHSTYEGRSVISKRFAKETAITDFKSFVVDSDSINREKIVKGGVIKGRKKPFLIGTTSKQGTIVQEHIWDKRQDFHITDVIEQGNGRSEIVGYRILPTVNGTRWGDAADKMTATVAKDEFALKLFGVDAIKDTVIGKKKFYGELLNTQTALVMDEINQLTVGKTVKKSIAEEVALIYNNFFRGITGSAGGFGTFAYEGANGPVGLMVPEQIIGMRQSFKYNDFYQSVYGQVNDVVNRYVGNATGQAFNFDIYSKLQKTEMVNGQEVTMMMGVSRSGRPPMEPWQKAVGFNADRGIVKWAAKPAEIFALQGLSKTSDLLTVLSHKEINKSLSGLGGRTKIEKTYVDVMKNLVTGEVNTDDLHIKINEINGPNEVGIGVFKKVPRADYLLDATTMSRYKGTIHGLENVVKLGEGVVYENGLSSDFAKKALNKGSAILELPDLFEVGGQLRDSIRISIGTPQGVGSHGLVSLDKLTKAAGTVFSAVQDYVAGPLKGQTTAQLREAVERAIGAYDEEVAQGLSSSRGFIEKAAETGRLKGSGRLVMSAFDPFDKRGNSLVGVTAVNEEYFNDLFKGLSKEEMVTVKSLATYDAVSKGKGLYVLVGRDPDIAYRSESVQKLVIDNSIGEYTVGRISAIDQLTMKGDNDSDTMKIIASHLDPRIDAATRQGVQEELAQKWNDDYLKRVSLQNILVKEYEAAEHPSLTVGSLSNTYFTNRAGYDSEAVFARIIKSDVGIASNLNTYMRRIAGELNKYEDITGFTREDMKKMSVFGELLEQDVISAKHQSFDKILEGIKGKNFGIHQVTPEIQAQVEGIFEERLTVGRAMLDAVKNQDKTAFINANRIVKAIKMGDTMGEWDSIKQPYSFDEMWNSTMKAVDLYGDDSTISKLGTKTGFKKSVDLYNLMFNADKSNTMLSSRREMAGFDDTDREARFRASLENKMEVLRGEAQASPLPEGMFFTEGEAAEEIARKVKLGSGGIGAGSLVFAGLMLATGFVAGNGLSDKVDHDIAIGEGGYAMQQPIASTPGPTARVVRNDTGYENINVSIKARDMAGMSQEEIGAMIQSEISQMMPMDVNFNISKKDNSQKLDSIWVQNVMNNAINKGYGY
jgi:hypothetical protein